MDVSFSPFGFKISNVFHLIELVESRAASYKQHRKR